jgi:hypothetical protein
MLCRVIVISFLALALARCDRSTPTATTATTQPDDVTLELELKPLTPLLPNRQTHVTVDHLGNVYWVQEGDRGDDTMFVIGEGDIPRASKLSAANIAAALKSSGGRGNIQGISAGAAGEIYFYFNGNLGRTTIAAIGQYFPRSARIRILADTSALSSATKMGRSLALARGTVVSDGRYVWIWVRHSDAWSMFKLEPIKLAAEGLVPLTKPFETVTLDDKPLNLTRDEYELSIAPQSSLYLTDPLGSQLLRIDPEGRATVARNLAGLPEALSTPSVDRRGQMLIFAAGNSPILKPATTQQAETVKSPDMSYPAMLFFDGDAMTAIERDRILAYPGFPIFGLRLRRLIPNPGAEEWLSYDAGSGELMRLKVRQRVFD